MENLILLKKEELEEIIRGQVQNAIKSFRDNQIKLMNEDDVKKYLGVSHATLYRWANDGKLVPLRMGRKIRWLRSDIDAFLQRKEA